MAPYKSVLFLIMAFTCYTLTAQQNKEIIDGNDNVRIVKDYRLDLMLERLNKNDKIKGFRIQIHSGLRRETARKSKSQFLLLFPETGCYEKYQQPNYVVKVGDFFTKIEAQCFLNKLRERFPNSFIIPDDIDPMHYGERKKGGG